jgi:F0F1-type ATP synthase membrane subunit a
MMLLMTGVLCLVFGLGFRRPQVVPRGCRTSSRPAPSSSARRSPTRSSARRTSRRFAPYLTALFFFIFAMNITRSSRASTCPVNGLAALPLVLA